MELEFRIRTQPSFGTLSEVRALADGSASVTYTPLPASDASEDRFSYAVKTRDGVSAAAEVHLTFIAKLPRIVGPASLQFPETAVGETSSVRFEIQNLGEAPGAVDLQVPSPWKLVAPNLSKLEPGASRSFTIEYSPQTPGRDEAPLHLLAPANRVIALSAKALPALELSPELVVLESDTPKLPRSATVTLSNHTSKPQEIRFKSDPRLKIQSVDSIPPKSKISLSLQLGVSDVAALETTISVQGHDTVLTARSPALPARLEFVPPSLDYGSLFLGTRSTQKAKLTNTGGQIAETKLHAPAPLSLLTTDTLRIPPLATVEIPVVFSAQTVGACSAHLEAQIPSGTVSIPVRATVLQPPEPPAKPVTTSALPRALPPRTEAPPPKHPFRPLDGPIEFRGKTVLLHWKGDLQRPLQHRAELRQLALQGEDDIVENWVPLPDFSPKIEGDFLQGSYEGAPSGRISWIRIVPVDERGVSTGEPWLASFRMPGEENGGGGGVRILGWVMGGLVGVGGAVWGLRRRRL